MLTCFPRRKVGSRQRPPQDWDDSLERSRFFRRLRLDRRGTWHAEPIFDDSELGLAGFEAIVQHHDQNSARRTLFAEIRPMLPDAGERRILEANGYEFRDYLNYVIDTTADVESAGIKLSRDEDVDNVIVANHLIFNRAAGILASDNIFLQSTIDLNRHSTRGRPLIWDGYAEDERSYRTLKEVRDNTPWEQGEFLLRLLNKGG